MDKISVGGSFDRFEKMIPIRISFDHDEPITLGSRIGLACFDPDPMINNRSILTLTLTLMVRVRVKVRA